MTRVSKILGLAIVVAAILALAVGATVSAASNNPGTSTQTQDQGAECLCGGCPCGECVCADCEPINHAYNYDYSSPGTHGFENGQ
jgi:hypothetical protein